MSYVICPTSLLTSLTMSTRTVGLPDNVVITYVSIFPICLNVIITNSLRTATCHGIIAHNLYCFVQLDDVSNPHLCINVIRSDQGVSRIAWGPASDKSSMPWPMLLRLCWSTVRWCSTYTRRWDGLCRGPSCLQAYVCPHMYLPHSLQRSLYRPSLPSLPLSLSRAVHCRKLL